MALAARMLAGIVFGIVVGSFVAPGPFVWALVGAAVGYLVDVWMRAEIEPHAQKGAGGDGDGGRQGEGTHEEG